MLDNLFNDDFYSNKDSSRSECLVQNFLPTRAPAFCTHPTFYVQGGEKRVKIGKESFNYIDYLEAWDNIDCGTYRTYSALEPIYRKIKAAFATIEQS